MVYYIFHLFFFSGKAVLSCTPVISDAMTMVWHNMQALHSLSEVVEHWGGGGWVGSPSRKQRKLCIP